VCTAVRRSSRLKALNKGYKAKHVLRRIVWPMLLLTLRSKNLW
jgi:hypothetical protein